MIPNRILITGGAGFIGSNLAYRLLEEGKEITLFDNLSRPGCTMNLAWLRDNFGQQSFRLVVANVTDFAALERAAKGADCIFHLAGQVAVTTSVKNPRQDFEDNALGTLNALEAARLSGNDPVFIYASTNKVYGGMEDVSIVEEATRYRYTDFPCGIPESRLLDFHSPYGCSKGAGDQYTRDYHRIYRLRSVVLRQSCIYGYRQFGLEDQGWLAWFLIAALKDRSINIYGNGKQVRDVLFVEDLINTYLQAVRKIDRTAGQIYNIGGGIENTISIWCEFGPLLEELLGHPVPVHYADWRPGDQPIYISDIRKAQQELDWRPTTPVREGVTRLFDWVRKNIYLFSHL